MACELNLHSTLNKLLPFAVKYSLISNSDNQSITKALFPTNTHLSIAIYALSCSFIYQNTKNKISFASTGQTPLNMIDTSFGNSHTQLELSMGNTLHKLLSVGISKGCFPSIRSICLNILSSMVSIESPILPSLKNALILSTVQCLQTSSHLSTLDEGMICHLINVLAAFIQNQGGGLLSYSVNDNKIKLLPVIELLQSIWEMVRDDHNPLYCSPEISAAICRCISNICTMTKSNASLSKRTISSALSASIAVILTNCFKDENSIVSNYALIPLWYIVHDSEKVKCLVKEELKDFYVSQEMLSDVMDKYSEFDSEEKVSSQNGYFYLDTRIIERAKVILFSLLN